MAIDTGILVGCSGLQSVGGIRQIIVGDIVDIDTVTTGTGHSYDALTTASGQAHAKFEFRNESASMNISTSKENGNTTHEITLSWYLPNTDGTAFEILKEMETACMFAVVEGINGTKWALGISEKYATGANSGSAAASANFADYFNYAELTSVEGGSGAAFGDDSGVTITLTCKQFELPREYTGAITLNGNTVTLA